MMIAAQWQQTSVVKLLLERGANIEARDSCGRTALYYAMHYCNEEATRMLLEHGANSNAVDSQSMSILHHAAHDGIPNIISLLLSFGARLSTAALKDLRNGDEEDFSAAIKQILDANCSEAPTIVKEGKMKWVRGFETCWNCRIPRSVTVWGC
ncbi:ankyrin [Wilcoxina mikolae CBS 423.85]|nr:ankyrin [Wilcoxina mikolae CBS 423.85]